MLDVHDREAYVFFAKERRAQRPAVWGFVTKSRVFEVFRKKSKVSGLLRDGQDPLRRVPAFC
jgi:hypothetical protein